MKLISETPGAKDRDLKAAFTKMYNIYDMMQQDLYLAIHEQTET